MSHSRTDLQHFAQRFINYQASQQRRFCPVKPAEVLLVDFESFEILISFVFLLDQFFLELS
jgi:hypothetical protein